MWRIAAFKTVIFSNYWNFHLTGQTCKVSTTKLRWSGAGQNPLSVVHFLGHPHFHQPIQVTVTCQRVIAEVQFSWKWNTFEFIQAANVETLQKQSIKALQTNEGVFFNTCKKEGFIRFMWKVYLATNCYPLSLCVLVPLALSCNSKHPHHIHIVSKHLRHEFETSNEGKKITQGGIKTGIFPNSFTSLLKTPKLL